MDRESAAGAEMTARVIHVALMSGVALTFVVLALLVGLAPVALQGQARTIVRVAGYGLLVVDFVMAKVVRDRIQPARHGMSPGDWWADNLQSAVVLWAVLEGAGLAAIVLGFVGGDRVLQGLGAAYSLVLLYSTRPARLTGR